MEKTCCFFGHKDTPESVKADLYDAIEKLIVEYGVDTFYTQCKIPQPENRPGLFLRIFGGGSHRLTEKAGLGKSRFYIGLTPLWNAPLLKLIA